MKFETLLKVLGEVTVVGKSDIDISGIAYHADSVSPGSCFVAIRGKSVDGHRFVRDAVAKGASVVVTDMPVPVPEEVTNVVVEDTRDALARLSSAYFDDPSLKMKLVGVTGTNGKTTITYLMESIFEAAGFKPGIIGTVEYRFGSERRSAPHTTPESYDLQKLLGDMASSGVDACAMEVSSHALDMGRVVGCHFDGAIFTNLSPEHLDYHGEMEAYYESKARLFGERLIASVKGGAFAVVNVDDPYGRRLAASVHVPLWRYGLCEDADVTCSLVSSDRNGVSMAMRTPVGRTMVHSKLLGRFNALNILAAVSASLAMGIELEVIKEAVERVERIPGRLESVPNGRDILAFVDYAHTPDALKNVLLHAADLAKGRLIVVFGCGGDRDREKRPLMGKVVAEKANAAVVTNDNPRTEDPMDIIGMIEPGLEEGGMKEYEIIPDRREAIARAVDIARPGDVIVVAGKGHEDYQIIGTEKRHFDDKEVLEELLR
jgi:UDP-N-acetylmuramoyl-L-alanyl-D-glutamate--2,6-diaminopimelate ligase